MNGRTREREPRPGLPPGTRSRRVPQRALGSCSLSSRPLQGASAMGPRRLGENLPLRGGAGSALRVCPGVPGPAERPCHQRLRNDMREDEVDAAPDQVREGKAGRSAARYGGAFSDPHPAPSVGPTDAEFPTHPTCGPDRPLNLLGPLFFSYSRKKD